MREETIGPFSYRWEEGCFPITADSLCLGDFASPRPGERVLDLGCGAGLLLLQCARKAPGLTLFGVEREERAARCAQENLDRNGLTGTILTGDLRQVSLPPADLIVTNPPWFPRGAGAPAGGAKTEDRTLEEWCALAAGALSRGGRLELVHRPDRLADLFRALRRAGLEPKVLQLVQHRADTPPFAALVRAVKGGRPGLAVSPTRLTEP